MDAGLEQASNLAQQWQQGLPHLAGHHILWAWYVAVAESLRSGDHETSLKLLWEAGVSASILVRELGKDALAWFQASCASSERLNAAGMAQEPK